MDRLALALEPAHASHAARYEGALREQLNHVRSLSLSRGESTWLRGNTFYGKRQMFRPDFMGRKLINSCLGLK